MNSKKILVMLAALMVLTILFTAISCGPAPTAPPAVKETVIVKETVVVQAPAPTQAPTAPAPTPKPLQPGPLVSIKDVPKESLIQLVPVAGNANVTQEPNSITATIKYITDTKVGEASATRGLATAGLPNHPINVPLHFKFKVADPKNAPKVKWALTAPPNSKAKILNDTALATEFTPDLVGVYFLSVTATDAAGKTSFEAVQIHGGTYIGVNDGNCKQCHPDKTAEWAKTGHAILFSLEMDNKVDGPNKVDTHYSESCTACHTTGWYPPPYGGSGGYYDTKVKSGWKFPTWDLMNGAFAKKNPSNWDTAPAAIKNMGNIGCESCHGPAAQHVNNGAKVMVASFESGVCNQCHGAAANHSKGWQLANSGHGDPDSAAFEIAGPEEQACVRCHTPSGFVSFLADPKNSASWNNEAGVLGCAACHEPHSEANAWQLRVVGKPVETTLGDKAKDVGLSASCMTCHNGRRSAEDFAAGRTTSYPHYSTAAEMLSDMGGLTYGATVPNSPHAQLVGIAPIKNPAYDAVKNPTVAQFLYSAADDKKGNVPGSCVACHMVAGPSDAKDPNIYKVGGHSFNTKSPDGKSDYTESCKGCHAGLSEFNFKAKADYDGNGKTEGVQDEVKGLLNTLWKTLESKGLTKIATGNPYANIPANADAKVKNAWFNFRTVYGVMWGTDTGDGNQGKASAMHNFKRTVALLQLSLKDLGALPATAVEMK